jgi:hypothetical protein
MTPSRTELRGSRAATIFVAASVALVGAAVATPALSADAGPDFSGFWLRVGNLAFDAILDDDEGKPIARCFCPAQRTRRCCSERDGHICSLWHDASLASSCLHGKLASVSIARAVAASGDAACKTSSPDGLAPMR